MPTLRIKFANRSEVTHELVTERVTIGRRPDNLIQILDPSVSAHHAELIEENGHYRLHDLDSTNLCFVDDVPVTDYHLHGPCQITFGTVKCEYDPLGGAASSGLSMAQLERDLAFVRGENAELHGKVATLQRQMDILNSARLVSKKADNTPFAAANDALKGIVAERDELRHLTTGLRQELENVREELSATIQEREEARHALEQLKAEQAAQARELQELQRLMAPAAPGASANGAAAAVAPPPAFASSSSSSCALPATTDASTTQRVMLPPPAEFQPVANAIPLVHCALERFGTDPGALKGLTTAVDALAGAAVRLADHPISRLTMAMETLLQDLASRSETPNAAHLRTLSQAAELITRLLDPRCLERAKSLPHPRVLAVDDDPDMLHTLEATLELAQLQTTICAGSHEAEVILQKSGFDLMLLDVNLPDLDGPALCNRIREIERHRTLPVIFLTGSSTLDQRAQASLSGGNDFITKPFNMAELTVKVETLIWRNQLGLL